MAKANGLFWCIRFGSHGCNYSRIYLLINMMTADAIEALNTHQRRVNEQLPPRQMVGKPRFKARPGRSGNGSSVIAPKAYELNRASGHISAEVPLGHYEQLLWKEYDLYYFLFHLENRLHFWFLIGETKISLLGSRSNVALFSWSFLCLFVWPTQVPSKSPIRETNGSSKQELLQWMRSIDISSLRA